ncbi:DUF599 domain-containing protein [Leisingera methylohalidivorans]|uniref:Membrane protein n=1 Tax=Leisingera methylohalidivorans DSM 14336 TaxID=999552 RepID=V9VVB0_9RHOB|nr:DUF599 domain-containing protein [Leisingera methylohalidivorans]AHD01878.1 membrane protein [Leisingera methylohalidivorans DSM 14336]
MIWTTRLAQFSLLDPAALALLIAGWLWIGWRIENPPAGRPSVSWLMADFRRDWMKQMVERDPRIFDAQLAGNLRQATAFFASATMIAIGGGLALIGNTEQLAGVAEDLIQDSAPAFVWEVKILVVLLFLSNAFLKFVWSHRLFGYCSVLMAAVPNDRTAPLAYPRAAQAAEISITAARSFNRGMRATYFSLAAVAWLAGALPLAGAALITVAVLYRREFASHSRTILLRIPPVSNGDSVS